MSKLVIFDLNDTPSLPDPYWLEILRHTVGAESHIPKSKRGYRNHYNVSVGTADHQILLAMVRAGLMRSGVLINDRTAQYFYATKAGCKAIGLHKAAIKRVFQP